MRRSNKIGQWLIGAVIVVVISLVIFLSFGTSSAKRALKDVKSEYGGGLQRTVTVYSGNEVVREYKGKVDIKENDYGNKVIFELDGKRKAIYNAVVIVEEE